VESVTRAIPPVRLPVLSLMGLFLFDIGD